VRNPLTLYVRDIMTRNVVTLAPETTLREAMEILSTAHLSGAPVVSGGKVKGVVTITDLLGFIVNSPPPNGPSDATPDEWQERDEAFDEDAQTRSVILGDGSWNELLVLDADVGEVTTLGGSLLDQHTVEEIMTEDVVKVSPGTPVYIAALMMFDRAIHRIIVMNRTTLVGLVSAMDIARVVGRRGIGLTR
jgi:CBS-domain-containing membrane protein